MVARQLEGFHLVIDGASYYGQVKGVELPDLESETTDKMSAGGIGTQELPRILSAMEATITTSQYSDELVAIGADHYTTRQFQLLASIGEMGNGATDSKQKIVTLTGRVKSYSGGEMDAESEIEQELTLAVDAYKQEYDGSVLHDVAIDPPKWIVNGTNLIAQRNANLGIA